MRRTRVRVGGAAHLVKLRSAYAGPLSLGSPADNDQPRCRKYI